MKQELKLGLDNLSRIARYLQIVVLAALILYFGKTLFIPLAFGLLIAIIMYPVCKWMENRNWPRPLAIASILIFIAMLFSILVWLLSVEINIFIKDLPAALSKLQKLSLAMQNKLHDAMGISIDMQNQWINKVVSNLQNNLGNGITATLGTTIELVFMLILVPIYTALFLYHREVFIKYLDKISGPKYKGKVHLILQSTTHTYFNFVKGTFMVYIVVGILNTIGLLLLGIKYALLYGMLTAFMTIIPYIGILVSALLPISAALITKDSLWYPAGIIIVFSFVQYLEANIIFPKIVSAQLNVSTLATMIAIIIGTILWGVAGMILFIPFVAILKIITDHIDELKSLNILLSRNPR